MPETDWTDNTRARQRQECRAYGVDNGDRAYQCGEATSYAVLSAIRAHAGETARHGARTTQIPGYAAGALLTQSFMKEGYIAPLLTKIDTLLTTIEHIIKRPELAPHTTGRIEAMKRAHADLGAFELGYRHALDWAYNGASQYMMLLYESLENADSPATIPENAIHAAAWSAIFNQICYALEPKNDMKHILDNDYAKLTAITARHRQQYRPESFCTLS